MTDEKHLLSRGTGLLVAACGRCGHPRVARNCRPGPRTRGPVLHRSRDTEIGVVRGHVECAHPRLVGVGGTGSGLPLKMRRAPGAGVCNARRSGAPLPRRPLLQRRHVSVVRVIALGRAAVPCPAGVSCGRRSAAHGSSAADGPGWPSARITSTKWSAHEGHGETVLHRLDAQPDR